MKAKEYTFEEYNRKGEHVNTFKVVAKNYDEAMSKLYLLPEYQFSDYYYVIFSKVRKVNDKP